MTHGHCHLLNPSAEPVREYRADFSLQSANRALGGSSPAETREVDRCRRGIRNASGQGEPTFLA